MTSAKPTLPAVVFLGAGPGAADLITVRGMRALAQASIVLHDALTDPALREYSPRARWIDVGKRGFSKAVDQARINALLVRFALAGERVVRLKGGDPSVFGRLEEELVALRAAGLQAEVIPGVTSALAAAASAQLPLTRRGKGRSVAFCTAMGEQGFLPAGHRADTEVFYMAGRQLPELARKLREAGWSAEAAVLVVSRAGWPDETCSHHCLSNLEEAVMLHAGRPTLVTIGAGASPLAPPTASATASNEPSPASAPSKLTELDHTGVLANPQVSPLAPQ